MIPKTDPADIPSAVSAVYETYPATARSLLLSIRKLVFETAALLPEAGALTETLKWGEPSYLTEATRSGTTLRLAWSQKRPDAISLFVNCQTSLVETWREQYGETLELVGNREIRLPLAAPLPIEALAHCIAMALTYHHRKTCS